MEPRYLCVGGWVTSIRDGQRHFVSARLLPGLYGVRPSQCSFVDNDERHHGVQPIGDTGATVMAYGRDMVVLRPDESGRYQVPRRMVIIDEMAGADDAVADTHFEFSRQELDAQRNPAHMIVTAVLTARDRRYEEYGFRRQSFLCHSREMDRYLERDMSEYAGLASVKQRLGNVADVREVVVDRMMTGLTMRLSEHRPAIMRPWVEGGGARFITVGNPLTLAPGTPVRRRSTDGTWEESPRETVEAFVAMDPVVARAVDGLNLTTVRWEDNGGRPLNFRMMTEFILEHHRVDGSNFTPSQYTHEDTWGPHKFTVVVHRRGVVVSWWQETDPDADRMDTASDARRGVRDSYHLRGEPVPHVAQESLTSEALSRGWNVTASFRLVPPGQRSDDAEELRTRCRGLFRDLFNGELDPAEVDWLRDRYDRPRKGTARRRVGRRRDAVVRGDGALGADQVMAAVTYGHVVVTDWAWWDGGAGDQP